VTFLRCLLKLSHHSEDVRIFDLDQQARIHGLVCYFGLHGSPASVGKRRWSRNAVRPRILWGFDAEFREQSEKRLGMAILRLDDVYEGPNRPKSLYDLAVGRPGAEFVVQRFTQRRDGLGIQSH
jgi:hypothetical protein